MMRDRRDFKIGILAEDLTDCRTLEVLVGRLLAVHGKTASFARRGKDGCEHLMRKAKVWMAEMADAGCTALLFVHDLDRDPANRMLNKEPELRRRIEQIPFPKGIARHICIPIEELEAWFWSCPRVLERLAPGQGQSIVKPSPNLVTRPKESLIRLSASQHGGKARYTTQQNPELAALLDLDLCARRCPSFRDLQTFVAESVAAAS